MVGDEWAGSGSDTLHVTGVTDAAVFWLLQVYSTLCGVNAGNTDFWRADADCFWLGRCGMD